MTLTTLHIAWSSLITNVNNIYARIDAESESITCRCTQQPYQVISFNDVPAWCAHIIHCMHKAANAAIKHLTGFVFVWRRALNSACARKTHSLPQHNLIDVMCAVIEAREKWTFNLCVFDWCLFMNFGVSSFTCLTKNWNYVPIQIQNYIQNEIIIQP